MINIAIGSASNILYPFVFKERKLVLHLTRVLAISRIVTRKDY